ncbi:glycoside hydrolase family 18 protein [Epithele typhae]|uniref:glycoside hydrolase family 18 protein n=1 Tax=Epithele typhae TaxID=378194 RepID=UPI0020081E3B|nr:glycoside hydrolase family 18 protein [Epithele typhae]KAH9940901.1 glycoside hydrolase family 18 protein [Epithele typhae]
MFATPLRRFFGLVTFYLVLQMSSVTAIPYGVRALEARATQAAPHFVAYADKYQSGVTGPPAVSAIKGFNVFLLSFWLVEGAWDKAYEWTTLSATDRASIKSQYAAAGIKLMVFAFGSTDVPTTSNYNPTTLANSLSSWVIQYGLDGVDIDYEDFNAMDGGSAEAWLITFTTALRKQLPVGQYIVTHAPVAPWFTPSSYPGGGYLKVHSAVGNLIDWYNIQFYNQGASEYTTCSGLITASSSTWPQTALLQIAANGVPMEKLVIGKPATTGDANNGYIAPSTLATCVQQAKNKGWTGGVMTWQYPDAGTAWITTVRSLSWPV